MADLAQAAFLELALRALDNRDRPALAGALATLDHLAAVISHPVWGSITADLPPVSRLLEAHP